MRVLFIDTETNGKPLDYADYWPRLVQVAWLEAIDGSGAARSDYSGAVASRIVAPTDWTIPPGAEAIHGISTAKAMEVGIDLDEVLTLILAAACRSQLLVAHNADFDRNVLIAELVRAGRREDAELLFGKQWLCTMRNTTNLVRLRGFRSGSFKWPTLTELHQFLFGEEPGDRLHSADGDVAVLARCYAECKRRDLL